MDEPEMMELQDVRDQSLPSFIVYHPTNIRKSTRTLHLRILAAGLLGMLTAGVVFIVAYQIMLAARPSTETTTSDPETFIDLDAELDEEDDDIFLDLDLDNPIDLKELQDYFDITAPPLTNQENPDTPTLQDTTVPVLVFYRTAKTPSRLPTQPGNITHLYSSLSDPAPSTNTPPVTTTACTDPSPSPHSRPHYRVPFITLFTKIHNRFVAITPSVTIPTATSATASSTTTTTTSSVTTTATPTPATTTTTTTVTSSIAVTLAPYARVSFIPRQDKPAVEPLTLNPPTKPRDSKPENASATSIGYTRGTVMIYVLLGLLLVLMMMVVYEIIDLYWKEPWSLWMADTIRRVDASAVRRRVVSRHGDMVALRTLRQGNRSFFQVTDANPTPRNPHHQPCCPPNCGIVHFHHLPRVSPVCPNPRWFTRPGRH